MPDREVRHSLSPTRGGVGEGRRPGGHSDPSDPSDLDLFTRLRLWTAKEAVYKALRATALPLEDIVVDLPAMRATALGRSFALSHYPLRGQLLTLARRL